MRIWHIVLLLGMGGAVWASPGGPIELPPDDFTGAQYIDSAGCVYLRQGAVWAPRLDRDGTVICGYPPTFPDRPGTADTAADPALRLAVTLAEGLQDGDLRDDPNDPLRRNPVETPPARSGPLSDLGPAAAVGPAMRAATAGHLAGGADLCGLLGYDASDGAPGRESTQSALGFCTGGAPALERRVTVGTGQDGQGDAGISADRTRMSAAQPARPAASGTDQPATPRVRAVDRTNRKAAAAGSAGKTTPKPPSETAADLREMIPPGARFVQIGRYPDATKADAAIRRLVALGYPVVRGTKPETDEGGRVVMAGPFAERRALIAALNHLRASGYARAVAR